MAQHDIIIYKGHTEEPCVSITKQLQASKTKQQQEQQKWTKNLQKNYTILIKFTVLCWASLSEFGRPRVRYAWWYQHKYYDSLVNQMSI